MTLTKKQRILNYAKQHPEGFTPKKMMEDTKIKDKNIWVMLSKMKKAGVLTHDPKTSLYKLGDVQQPLKAFNKKKKTAPVSSSVDASRGEVEYYKRLLDSVAQLHEQLEEKHQDALAIIRYLENKLYIAIQRDVDHNRGLDAGG